MKEEYEERMQQDGLDVAESGSDDEGTPPLPAAPAAAQLPGGGGLAGGLAALLMPGPAPLAAPLAATAAVSAATAAAAAAAAAASVAARNGGSTAASSSKVGSGRSGGGRQQRSPSSRSERANRLAELRAKFDRDRERADRWVRGGGGAPQRAAASAPPAAHQAAAGALHAPGSRQGQPGCCRHVRLWSARQRG
jgi:hypothetical protein